MKILHLLSQRPDSTGSGIYIQAMLRESQDQKHKNFLIAGLDGDTSPKGSLFDNTTSWFLKFRSDSLPFPIPGMSDVMPYHSSRFQDLTPLELNTYLQSFSACLDHAVAVCKPDIIHSHHLWLLSSLAKVNFPEIPMVTSCHGSDLRQFQNCTHLRDRVVEGCRKIDVILALTNHQRQQIQTLYSIPQNKIEVIGTGIDLTTFNNKDRVDTSVATIIYAGKLSRAKGVPWLLRALHRLKTPRWHLHLIGSGTGRDLDECLQEARLLQPNITIHGSLHQDEVADLMRRSDIFVLPSFFEGLPLVILEAIACGCKVVATKLPACIELRQKIPKNLLSLVNLPRLKNVDIPYPEDEENFVENIAYALEKAILTKTGSALTETDAILKEYTWNNIFNKIVAIYKKNLSSK